MTLIFCLSKIQNIFQLNSYSNHTSLLFINSLGSKIFYTALQMTINNQSLPAQGLYEGSGLYQLCRREITHAGLLLRGRGWGFPPATMEVAPGYFQ